MSAPKRNIALLCGGYTAERPISLQGAEVLSQHIHPGKYNCYRIDVRRDAWVVLPGEIPLDKNDFSFSPAEGGQVHFDLALILIHGDPGENGQLQAYLDMLGIPYTNCDHYTSALTFNKHFCKRLVAGNGLRCADDVLLRKGMAYKEESILNKLKLPVFVKPNKNGSSYGISKVKEAGQLEEAIKQAFRYDDEVLVEAFVQGKEVTCGVFRKGGEMVVLPLTEICTRHEFFNYTAKYTSGEADEITPARISPQLTNTCQDISRRIYHSLNCRGICRFDFLLDDRTFYFLEANTVPGMSLNSIIPKQAKAAGISLGELIEASILECLEQEDLTGPAKSD